MVLLAPFNPMLWETGFTGLPTHALTDQSQLEAFNIFINTHTCSKALPAAHDVLSGGERVEHSTEDRVPSCATNCPSGFFELFLNIMGIYHALWKESRSMRGPSTASVCRPLSTNVSLLEI
jgi:hypothetical protein